MLQTNYILPYHMEINRKLVHLSSLWMPVAIYFLEPRLAAGIFALLLGGMLIYEVIRRQNHFIARLARDLTGFMLRAHETESRFQLTGASYVLIAALIAVLCFSKVIAITALSIMLISDTAAALIGRQFGRAGVLGKSWVGSLAFIVSGFITVLILSQLLSQSLSYLISGCIATITAMIVERYSNRLRVDDNLSITIAATLTMWVSLSIFS